VVRGHGGQKVVVGVKGFFLRELNFFMNTVFSPSGKPAQSESRKGGRVNAEKSSPSKFAALLSAGASCRELDSAVKNKKTPDRFYELQNSHLPGTNYRHGKRAFKKLKRDWACLRLLLFDLESRGSSTTLTGPGVLAIQKILAVRDRLEPVVYVLDHSELMSEGASIMAEKKRKGLAAEFKEELGRCFTALQLPLSEAARLLPMPSGESAFCLD
jgi:hypothetical protein